MNSYKLRVLPKDIIPDIDLVRIVQRNTGYRLSYLAEWLNENKYKKALSELDPNHSYGAFKTTEYESAEEFCIVVIDKTDDIWYAICPDKGPSLPKNYKGKAYEYTLTKV